jgi:hypothetical protein
MQESGVGLYYGESFNTFKELRQSLKYRFSRRDSLGRVISREEYRKTKQQKRDKQNNETKQNN